LSDYEVGFVPLPTSKIEQTRYSTQVD